MHLLGDRPVAWSIGMTKPMFDAWRSPLLAATAVLMPTTWPAALTSGPPELPELIAASVWIRPSSVALLGVDRAVERRHDALGHRRAALEGEGVADGDDLVADGDVAGGERGRDDAGGSSSWSTAMSSRQRAAERPSAERSSPLTVTVTSSASATTWALVRMWPSVSRTMPVPAPSA